MPGFARALGMLHPAGRARSCGSGPAAPAPRTTGEPGHKEKATQQEQHRRVLLHCHVRQGAQGWELGQVTALWGPHGVIAL